MFNFVPSDWVIILRGFFYWLINFMSLDSIIHFKLATFSYLIGWFRVINFTSFDWVIRFQSSILRHPFGPSILYGPIWLSVWVIRLVNPFELCTFLHIDMVCANTSKSFAQFSGGHLSRSDMCAFSYFFWEWVAQNRSQLWAHPVALQITRNGSCNRSTLSWSQFLCSTPPAILT